MYVETDFVLALIKDEDWLSEKAEKIYNEKKENLWTSEYTLLELMLVGYRDNKNVLRLVSETIELLEIRGDPSRLESAAVYVEEEGLTPLDAVHLASSNGEKIISSDKSYDQFTERLALEEEN